MIASKATHKALFRVKQPIVMRRCGAILDSGTSPAQMSPKKRSYSAEPSFPFESARPTSQVPYWKQCVCGGALGPLLAVQPLVRTAYAALGLLLGCRSLIAAPKTALANLQIALENLNPDSNVALSLPLRAVSFSLGLYNVKNYPECRAFSPSCSPTSHACSRKRIPNGALSPSFPLSEGCSFLPL